MRQSVPWFIEARGEALAVVMLTRRSDLLISKPLDTVGPDGGLDYVIQILEGGMPSKRIFGVQLKAGRGIHSSAEAARLVTQNGWYAPPRPSFPVCVFVFSVEDDRGFYTWAVEPVYSADGSPRLSTPSAPSPEPLDDGALDEIVRRVNDWYETEARAEAA
jgi:hypothetical protein